MSTTSPSAFVADAGPVDVGTDAPAPDAGEDAGSDAGADAGSDAGATGCGWDEGLGSYICGGSDPAPDTVVCTGDECCTPNTCSPEEDQVCCNMVTGAIRTIAYGGGTCEEIADPCTE